MLLSKIKAGKIQHGQKINHRAKTSRYCQEIWDSYYSGLLRLRPYINLSQTKCVHEQSILNRSVTAEPEETEPDITGCAPVRKISLPHTITAIAKAREEISSKNYLVIDCFSAAFMPLHTRFLCMHENFVERSRSYFEFKNYTPEILPLLEEFAVYLKESLTLDEVTELKGVLDKKEIHQQVQLYAFCNFLQITPLLDETRNALVNWTLQRLKTHMHATACSDFFLKMRMEKSEIEPIVNKARQSHLEKIKREQALFISNRSSHNQNYSQHPKIRSSAKQFIIDRGESSIQSFIKSRSKSSVQQYLKGRIMKKDSIDLKVDSRNRVSLTKLSGSLSPIYKARLDQNKIILEPVNDIPAEEAWLFLPKTKRF